MTALASFNFFCAILRASFISLFYWIFFRLFHFSCRSIILIILFLLKIFIGGFLEIVLVPDCGSDHFPLLVLFAVFLSPLPLCLLDCLLSESFLLLQLLP